MHEGKTAERDPVRLVHGGRRRAATRGTQRRGGTEEPERKHDGGANGAGATRRRGETGPCEGRRKARGGGAGDMAGGGAAGRGGGGLQNGPGGRFFSLCGACLERTIEYLPEGSGSAQPAVGEHCAENFFGTQHASGRGMRRGVNTWANFACPTAGFTFLFWAA